MASKKNVAEEQRRFDTGRRNRDSAPFWPQLGPVVFLAVIFLINFIARIILSPLLPTIEKELGIATARRDLSSSDLGRLCDRTARIGIPGVPFESQNYHRDFYRRRWTRAPGDFRREQLMGNARRTLRLGVRRWQLFTKCPFGDRKITSLIEGRIGKARLGASSVGLVFVGRGGGVASWTGVLGLGVGPFGSRGGGLLDAGGGFRLGVFFWRRFALGFFGLLGFGGGIWGGFLGFVEGLSTLWIWATAVFAWFYCDGNSHFVRRHLGIVVEATGKLIRKHSEVPVVIDTGAGL